MQHDRQEAVGADLRQHPGEDHQHLDRHRAVAVGHPAVQRERRHLHEEGGGEQQEDPLLGSGCQRRMLKGAVGEVEAAAVLLGGEHSRCDGAREHQQRADERVDHELGGRARAGRALRVAPPAPDQEVEGDQHQIEERHEQDQVLREERAEHRRLGEHQLEVEAARALGRTGGANVAGQHGGGEDQRAHRDQGDVQPGDGELVVDAQRGDPHRVGHVLQALPPGLVVDEVGDREAERGQRAHERGDAGGRPGLAHVAAGRCRGCRGAARARGRQDRPEHAEGEGQPEEDREGRHRGQLCSRK